MLALLIALTLSLTFFFKSANTGRNSYAGEATTAETLAQAKAALIGYSATYRDTHPDQGFGYLLCPDLDNDGDAEGVCGNKGETMIGRLPYKTLGLPDLRAADGECLWYVVSGSHKNNPKAGPLNWDTQGRIRIQDSSGTTLIAPEDDNGGAVAAVIAPGPPLPGQDRPGGNSRCSGNASNSNIAAYLDGSYAAATAATLSIVAGLPGSTTNNDRVAWISARELLAPVAKRRDLLGPLLTQLTNCLNLTGGKHIPTVNKVAAGNAKWVSSAAGIDEVMTALGASVCPAAQKDSVVWENWSDHFRYVVCSDPSNKCIQVNGVSCSGAILFGGRMVNGNPRTLAEKLVMTNYFDSGNANTLSTAANALSGSTLYDGTNPDSDVAICLQPAP